MTSQELDEREIFSIARRLNSPEARAEYLRQVCGNNRDFLERITSLLRGFEGAGSFLESPPLGIADTVGVPRAAELPGTIIGRYKLLEEIAEGGMGVVYMAEQREPVRRKVALKIIKPGMDTRAVIARFEVERQALAMMDHPNVAKLFDAGETESGRSYFVMELVHGIHLTDYCDQNELTTRERLELFVQVCQGVHHAHQKGIIHRDLKPSNVMVTLYDGVPIPKIIDFGIVKATDGQLAERSVFTNYGQMIGTPLYMSPEQAEMSGLDVDTRSDIYSLGMMLYELLTGSKPFDEGWVKVAGFDEIRRMIREDDPPRPSARISTLGEAAVTISMHRKSNPDKLSGLLRRDLDWIVMKSLEKDRARRYQTASDFARDIQRYLADEPIEARRQTQRERLSKWVRRHRKMVSSGVVFLFGGAAAAILFTIIFLVSTGEGTVKLEFADADAARQCTVSVDGNDIRIEKLGEPIKLRAGKHQLRVRHGDLEIETQEFDILQHGTQVLHVSLPPGLPQLAAAQPKNIHVPPSARTAALHSEFPAQQNPLLPRIVFGEWFPLLPPADQILGWDRLNDHFRYSNRTHEKRDKEWIPLLTSPNQLVGWEALNDHVRYSNRSLETLVGEPSDGVGTFFRYQVVATNVSIRARAKRISSPNIGISLRDSAEGKYIAWFNGGRWFGIGKWVNRTWINLAEVESPQSCNDFFDFQFSAVGDALTLSVNGRSLLHIHDSSNQAGTVAVGGRGSGLFTDVAIKIPTEASLVADNRQLAGPFADVPIMEDLCTHLLRKDPDNLAIYKQRAEVRARYAQKWPQAAEDLAKVIELKADDFSSWHRRTMLLVKLQQKDLLAEHLAIMLAKFQDDSGSRSSLVHSLTTFPIGGLELIQGGELLADKLPNDPERQFWSAFARYRAGKYEEAEKLFSTAEADAAADSLFSSADRYELPMFQTLHAMINAKLNAREKANALLSKARAALKKATLDDHSAGHGDYGAHWWDRLSAEALLAEAENLISLGKP